MFMIENNDYYLFNCQIAETIQLENLQSFQRTYDCAIIRETPRHFLSKCDF